MLPYWKTLTYFTRLKHSSLFNQANTLFLIRPRGNALAYFARNLKINKNVITLRPINAIMDCYIFQQKLIFNHFFLQPTPVPGTVVPVLPELTRDIRQRGARTISITTHSITTLRLTTKSDGSRRWVLIWWETFIPSVAFYYWYSKCPNSVCCYADCRDSECRNAVSLCWVASCWVSLC